MRKRVCPKRTWRFAGGEGEAGDDEQIVRPRLVNVYQIVPAEALRIFRHVADVDDGQAPPGLQDADHFPQRLLAARGVVNIVNRPA